MSKIFSLLEAAAGFDHGGDLCADEGGEVAFGHSSS